MADIATTLGALAEAEAALTRLAAVKLPYAAAYQLAKLTRAVTEELRHFHDQRVALVQACGEARPATPEERARGSEAMVMGVAPGSAQWDTFLVQARELAAVPVRLTVAPFDPASVPTLEVSAADLVALGPLVIAPDP